MSDLMLQTTGMMGRRVGGGVTYAKFDPLLTAAPITLSNGNLTASSSTLAWLSAYLDQQHFAGKFSFVFSVPVNPVAYNVGVADVPTLNDDIGSFANSNAWQTFTGNNSSVPSGGGAGAWDIIVASVSYVVLLDFDNDNIWCQTAVGDLSVSGATCSCEYIGVSFFSNAPTEIILNTGQTPFPPSIEAQIATVETDTGYTFNRGVFI